MRNMGAQHCKAQPFMLIDYLGLVPQWLLVFSLYEPASWYFINSSILRVQHSLHRHQVKLLNTVLDPISQNPWQSKCNLHSTQEFCYACQTEESESVQEEKIHQASGAGHGKIKEKGWLLPLFSSSPCAHRISCVERLLHSSWPEVDFVTLWGPNLHDSWKKEWTWNPTSICKPPDML